MKMSDAFKLPLSYVDVAEFTVNLTKDEVKAVQLSVNHVDALADALADLLKATNGYSAWWFEQQKNAEDVLAAYRGDK